MSLSTAQNDLLRQLGTSLDNGLTTDEASARREQDGHFNIVTPPINCPAWACVLLPCIKHVPSMKIFGQIKPDDAEVLRNSKWVRYDSGSLVKGDIIRLEEGDIVPADCVVLTVDSVDELLVDVRYSTGEDKPRSAQPTSATNPSAVAATAKPIQLFWGGQVVQGSTRAVVTAIGPNTLTASLIRESKFPPRGNVMQERAGFSEDVESGIALIGRNEGIQ